MNRRREDGRLQAEFLDPIEVRETSPGEIARATQSIADALERMIRPAPAQWHAFKPIWPVTAAESAALAERAARAAEAGVATLSPAARTDGAPG